MEQKQNTINDVINELKRLQVEHGNVPVISLKEDDELPFPAWPLYNEKENRIEF